MANKGRLEVPVVMSDTNAHLRMIAMRVNAALPKDGSEGASGAIPLKSYTVSKVPDATVFKGAIIYVSDETGGATIAFSDGTNWRRVQDRVVIS